MTIPTEAKSVASFYRFHHVPDVGATREEIERACAERSLCGTVLLASEGINATLAGQLRDLQDFIDAYFPDVDVKWSKAAPGNPVFRRLRVRERTEIVTFDAPLAPSQRVGRHVDAAEWNQLIADPDVLVLDVRNRYESDIGTFRGARRANTRNFREFRDFVDRELGAEANRPVAMFCTGGIRCEKASAYLLRLGFENRLAARRRHPRAYSAETGNDEGAFEGECFVFDERVAVTAGLEQGSYRLCPGCGQPIPVGAACSCPDDPRCG